MLDYQLYDRELEKRLRGVTAHDGNPGGFLDRLRCAAKAANEKGAKGRKLFAKYALRYISDERNIFVALEHLREHGGWSPGPDGVTYADLGRQAGEQFMYCRGWRDSIRMESYKPMGFLTRKIRKASGNGHRRIEIQNVEDRIISRGAHHVLNLILDPIFRDTSFGFRPRRTRNHAIIKAWELAVAEEKFFWVHVDVRDAYDNVRLNSLIELFKKHLPDQALLAFLKKLLRLPERTIRLSQGASHSSLGLNLLMHHKVDCPFPRKSKHVDLIRFADDILLIAKTPRAAKGAIKNLKRLLKGAGMEFKDPAPVIHDLRSGERADFLGFNCGLQGGLASISVAEQSVDRLLDKLLALEGDENAVNAAAYRLAGWFRQQAAAFSQPHADNILKRIMHTLESMGIYDQFTQPESGPGFQIGSVSTWRAGWMEIHGSWLRQLTPAQAKLFQHSSCAAVKPTPVPKNNTHRLRPGRRRRFLKPRPSEFEVSAADLRAAKQDCERCRRLVKQLESDDSLTAEEKRELAGYRQRITARLKAIRAGNCVNFQHISEIDQWETELEHWPVTPSLNNIA